MAKTFKAQNAWILDCSLVMYLSFDKLSTSVHFKLFHKRCTSTIQWRGIRIGKRVKKVYNWKLSIQTIADLQSPSVLSGKRLVVRIRNWTKNCQTLTCAHQFTFSVDLVGLLLFEELCIEKATVFYLSKRKSLLLATRST